MEVESGVSVHERPSADFQLTILPALSPTATNPPGPTAMWRIVAFFHDADWRCQVRPSAESRKTAEPSVRVAPAANRVPVQASEENWIFWSEAESAPSFQSPAIGVGVGVGAGAGVGVAVGPAAGGLMVAAFVSIKFGAGTVFFFNALSFVAVLVVIYRWRRTPFFKSVLPAERLAASIRSAFCASSAATTR